MQGPYRATAPKLRGEAPERLECWLRDGDRGRWIRSAFVKLWLGGIAGFAASQWGLGALAALPLAVALGWASFDWRGRKGDAAVSTSKHQTVARADGVNTIFGAASNHDIALDVARIEFVFEHGARWLSSERISHTLCLTEANRSRSTGAAISDRRRLRRCGTKASCMASFVSTLDSRLSTLD